MTRIEDEIRAQEEQESQQFMLECATIKAVIGRSIPDGSGLDVIVAVALDLLCHCIVRMGNREAQESMLACARATLNALEAAGFKPAPSAGSVH